MPTTVSRMLEDVQRFNEEIIGLPIPVKPTLLSEERFKHGAGHIQEELNEFVESHLAGDLEGSADALVDLIYVALGRLVEMGISPGATFDEVHRANMEKKRGDVAKRPGSLGFDAIKPEGWTAPDLKAFIDAPVRAVVFASEAMNLDNSTEEAKTAMNRLWSIRTSEGLGPMTGAARGSIEVDTPVYDKLLAEAKAKADPDTGFMKDDSGKECRPELIPAPVIYWLGCLYAHGAKKYDAENWRKGSSYQRYLGAMDRHTLRYKMGHRLDDTVGGSQCPELIAVAWNAMTLFMQEEMGVGSDDRPDKGYPCPKI